MIADIKLYEGKDEGMLYEQMNHNFTTTWRACLSADVVEWLTIHTVDDIKRCTWILEDAILVAFEDFMRYKYGAYPFEYSARYNSHALTFEFRHDYGIEILEG